MLVTDWQQCSNLADSDTASAVYYQNDFHLQTAMGHPYHHNQCVPWSHCFDYRG